MTAEHPIARAGPRAVRVVIVGDTRLYRESLAASLERLGPIDVVDTASDWPGAIDAIRAGRPEVVLVDASVSGTIPASRELRSSYSDVRIVAIGVPELEQAVIAHVEAGVASYVTREASVQELLRVVGAAAKGEVVLAPRMAGAVLRRLAELATRCETQPDVRLTSREHEIVRLIDEGLSNKQIAMRLRIELPTVKNHVHNILEKLGVDGRAQAAARVRGVVSRDAGVSAARD